MMQAAPSNDAPPPAPSFTVETKHGRTVAEAIAFAKGSKRLYVAVPYNGPDGDWNYFNVSKREALSVLARVKPDEPFTSLFKDYNNGRWGTVWLGSTYKLNVAPTETAGA